MDNAGQKEKEASSHKKSKELEKYAFIFLLWAISLAGVWMLACKNYQKQAETKEEKLYPLLNPRLRNFSREERNLRAFPTLIPLREKLFAYLGDRKSNVAFYVEDLNSGAWSGYRERDEFYPASLLKVPVAIGVMKKIDNGDWSLKKTIALRAEYRDKRFGKLWKEEEGKEIEIETLLEQMLGESDNTATNMLFKNLTTNERDEVYYHIGISNPEMIEKESGEIIFKKITARNLATFFRALYNATYLTRESSNYLLELLAGTKRDILFSTQIPDSVKVSHKSAVFTDNPDLPKNFHDCGITFFSDHPYLYCLMTENFNDPEAQEIITGMRNEVNKYFKKEDTD